MSELHVKHKTEEGNFIAFKLILRKQIILKYTAHNNSVIVFFRMFKEICPWWSHSQITRNWINLHQQTVHWIFRTHSRQGTGRMCNYLYFFISLTHWGPAVQTGSGFCILFSEIESLCFISYTLVNTMDYCLFQYFPSKWHVKEEILTLKWYSAKVAGCGRIDGVFLKVNEELVTPDSILD